mgnify:CR=1 FL=1
MTIQYEKMIVLLFNQLFMFRLQTAKILYDCCRRLKGSSSFFLLEIITFSP